MNGFYKIIEKLFYRLVLKTLLNFPYKRNAIILADAIFDDKMELVDNFLLFKKISQHKKWKAFYILNKKHKMAKELKAAYGEHILLYDKNDKYFIFRLIPIFLRLRCWLDGYFLLMSPFKELGRVLNSSNCVDAINTQHGVNCFKIGRWERSKRTLGPDVYNEVVVSTQQEQDFFEKELKFPKDKIISLGLSRWDSKPAPNRNDILVFFTWREYMRTLPKSKITSTQYFKNLVSLLKNEKLGEILKKGDSRLKLALHHVIFEKGLDEDFRKIPGVDVLQYDEVAEAKAQSLLLITDFSSMCFDFLFQGDQVVFYAIDSGDLKLFTGRDKEAWANVDRILSPCGNFTKSEDECVRLVESIIDRDVISNVFVPKFFVGSAVSINDKMVEYLQQKLKP